MAGNIFGTNFRVSTFGESHGKAVGVVVDGCPAGLELSESDIQIDLTRRRPGQSKVTTARDEKDQVEILSGVYEGKTTGAPIAMLVWNQDQRSQDYSEIKKVFRPGHADYTFEKKYGHRDPRGGGRTSARIMIGRVAAGAIAKKFLKQKFNMEFLAYTEQVGDVKIAEKSKTKNQKPLNLEIESKRLTLKPISFEYLQDIHKNFTHKVASFINPNTTVPKSISETAEFIHKTLLEIQKGEVMTFVALNPNFIGLCSIRGIITGEISFGLWVKESKQGMGYGKEMIKTLKQFAEENLIVEKFVYRAEQKNMASRKLVESLGGKEVKKYSEKSEKIGKEFLWVEYELPVSKSLEKDSKQLPLYETVTSEQIEANIVRCPDSIVAEKMIALIEKTRAEKDSVGGIIQGVIRNVPVGLGEPEFDKLPAELAKAMMSINATKGFEIGSGFRSAKMKGSQHNDKFVSIKKPKIRAILFDIDGVLSLPFGLTELIQKDYDLDNFEANFKEFWTKKFPILAIGKGDTIQELEPYLKKINWQKSPQEFINFWHKADHRIVKETFALVRDLKRLKYTVCVVTQQEPYRAKYLQKTQFPKLFNHWFVSSDLGLLKENSKFFEKVKDTLSFKPEEILHIDDSLKILDVSKKLGLQTFYFDPQIEPKENTANIKKILEKKIQIKTITNNAGGVLGGISNGQTIQFRVAIKPVATIGQSQETIDKYGKKTSIEGKGRHDPCVLPRAVPIVEAMSALVIMDMYLRMKSK